MAKSRNKLIRTYFSYYQKDRWRLLLSVALALFLSLLYFPIIFTIKNIVSGDLTELSRQTLIESAFILLGLIILTFAFQIWQRHLILNVVKNNSKRIRDDLFQRYYAFPKSYTDRHDASYLHTVLIQDVNRMDATMNVLFSSFIPSCLMILAITSALLYINAQLFLIVILLLPVLALLVVLLNRRLTSLYAEWRSKFRSFNKGILHILEILHLTQIQNAVDFEKTQMREKNAAFTALDIRIIWLQDIYQAIKSNWIWMMGILVIVLGGIAVTESQMSMGEVFLFYIVFNFMKKDAGVIIGAFPQFINGIEALERFGEVFVNDEKAPYQGTNQIEKIDTIELQDVSFSYIAGREVLAGVNIAFRKNCVTLIRGANGSGKTTLMHLILGFYQPQQGRIEVNGQSYSDIDIPMLRQRFGVVLQEAPLFSGTVLDNVSYGHPESSESDVLKACKLSTADDFIDQLPDGVHTEIGEKGVYLSGGQRQKIALARALIGQPDFIILDEPTNHLDHHSIQRILGHLKEMDQRPGLVIITHDESLYSLADETIEIVGNEVFLQTKAT